MNEEIHVTKLRLVRAEPVKKVHDCWDLVIPEGDLDRCVREVRYFCGIGHRRPLNIWIEQIFIDRNLLTKEQEEQLRREIPNNVKFRYL